MLIPISILSDKITIERRMIMVRICREEDYKNRKAVAFEYPSATKIVKVCGGWAVFDSITDYEIWRNQK